MVWKYIGINPFYNEVEENLETGQRRVRIIAGYSYEKEDKPAINFARIKNEKDREILINAFNNALFLSYFKDINQIYHIYCGKKFEFFEDVDTDLLNAFLEDYYIKQRFMKKVSKQPEKLNDFKQRPATIANIKTSYLYGEFCQRLLESETLLFSQFFYRNGVLAKNKVDFISDQEINKRIALEKRIQSNVILSRQREEEDNKKEHIQKDFLFTQSLVLNYFDFRQAVSKKISREIANTYFSQQNFQEYQYDQWQMLMGEETENSRYLAEQFILAEMLRGRKSHIVEIGLQNGYYSVLRQKDNHKKTVFSIEPMDDIASPYTIELNPFKFKDVITERKSFNPSVKSETVKLSTDSVKESLLNDALKVIWLTKQSVDYYGLELFKNYVKKLIGNNTAFIVILDDFTQPYAKEFNDFYLSFSGELPLKGGEIEFENDFEKAFRILHFVKHEEKTKYLFGFYSYGLTKTSYSQSIDFEKECLKLKRRQQKSEIETIVGDEFQRVPYRALSKLGKPTGLVNQDLEKNIYTALLNFKKRNGDIDEYVSSKLKIEKSVIENEKRLSCEQIDAIGLALDALNRKTGFILADETGFGKGRVLASLILAGIRSGKSVVFVTEKKQLFSDMYRDLQDVDPTMNLTPTVLHGDAKIYNQEGQLITKSKKESEFKAMLESDWGNEDKIIFTTYSQLGLENIDERLEWETKDKKAKKSKENKNKADNQEDKEGKEDKAPVTPKVDFLKRRLGENSWIILDEAHNAAGGTSNVSRNLIYLTQNSGVVFSSATYAKSEKNLELYNKILNLSNQSQKLVKQSLTGDDYLLRERLVLEMARSGSYIRREHPPIDLPALLKKPLNQQDLNAYNAFSNFWLSIYNLCVTIENYLDNASGKAWERIGGFQARSVKEFNMLIYTDFLIDQIEHFIKQGEKVVITLEMTFGAVLNDFINNDIGKIEEEDDIDDISDNEESKPKKERVYKFDQPVLWRERFKPLIEKMFGLEALEKTFKKKKAEEKAKIFADIATRREKLIQMIDTLPDFEISPMDRIARKLKEKGIESGELSGRTLIQSYEDNQYVIKNRSQEDRVFTVKRFNSGEFDVMFVTLAGCSGISLHAGAKFADQRKRNLIEWDITSNIANRIQFWGRVRRKDQVLEPSLWTAYTDALANIRQIENENKKRKKLAAHTGSLSKDRKLGVISQFGEQIVEEWANYYPDYAKVLGCLYGDKYNPFKRVNKALARSVLLPMELQTLLKNMLTYGLEVSFDAYNEMNEVNNIQTLEFNKEFYIGKDISFFETEENQSKMNAQKVEKIKRIVLNPKNDVQDAIAESERLIERYQLRNNLIKDKKLNAKQVFNLLVNAYDSEAEKNHFYFKNQFNFINKVKSLTIGDLISLSKMNTKTKTLARIVSFGVSEKLYDLIFNDSEILNIDERITSQKEDLNALYRIRNERIKEIYLEHLVKVGLSQTYVELLMLGKNEIIQIPLYLLWKDSNFETVDMPYTSDIFKLGEVNNIIQTLEGNPILLADVVKKSQIGYFKNFNDLQKGDVTGVMIENKVGKPFITNEHLFNFLVKNNTKEVKTLNGNLILWWSDKRERFTLSFDSKYYEKAFWIKYRENQILEREQLANNRIEREFDKRGFFTIINTLNENNLFFIVDLSDDNELNSFNTFAEKSLG